MLVSKELGPIFNQLSSLDQCAPGAVEAYYLKHFAVGRNGFFVECGAGNGLVQTNTGHLQRELGWSGLLIESHDLLYSELIKNRVRAGVKCLHETVGPDNGEVLFDEIIYDGSPWSEYLGRSSIVNKQGRFTTRKTARGMSRILREHDAPRIIDYCVIDVEDSAPAVLRTLNLDEFSVKFLAVEMRRVGDYCNAVNSILAKGYSLKHITPDGQDYIFVKD